MIIEMTGIKPQYHHGSLKQALIEHALNLLTESRFEELSLRKLAAGLGVNQTALYSHFKNKNALLAELAKHGFEQLIAQSHRLLNRSDSEEERLNLFAEHYLSFARQNTELFKLMFGPLFSHLHPENPELWEAAEASFSLFQKVVADYLQSIGSRTPAHLAVLTVWSFMHGFGYLVIGDRLGEESLAALDNEQLLEQLLSVIKDGLKS